MKKWMTSKLVRIVNLLLVGIFLLGLPTKAASLNISNNQYPNDSVKSIKNLRTFPANQTPNELTSLVDQNMERISQYGGWVKDFHIYGNRATLCVNSKIEILEFYVFGNTKIIGQTKLPEFELCDAVVSTSNYAYVAVSSGVYVLNISNPESISQVNFISASGPFSELSIDGDYLYLKNNANVIIYSLINPSEPLYLGTYYSGSWILSFTVSNNYMYVAKGTNGVVVVDLSDKSNPIQVSTFNYIGSASSVAIIGNYAYVSDNTEGTSLGLQIFDITYPLFPGIYEIITIPASQKVFSAGNVAYLMSDNLYLLDVSNPTNPIVASTLELSGLVELSEDRLYTYRGDTNQFDLGVLSTDIISNPYQPYQIDEYKYVNGAWDLAKKDNHVFLASDTFGLHILNISNPRLPYWVSGIDLPGQAKSITINGNYAYVACASGGLRIINISNVDFPSLVGQYDPEGEVFNVKIIGDLAFLASGNEGLIIVNISNPSNPYFVGQYNSPGIAFAIDVNGDFAFIADLNSDLQIINISNPSSPYLVGVFDTTFQVMDVLVSGNIVYLADNEGTDGPQASMRIIDISNPAQPTQLGVVTGIQFTDLAKEENIIFGTEYMGYIRAYDVTNPSQPLEAGLSEYYPPLLGLVVDQFEIFAVGYGGMFVVDYTGGGGGGELFEDVRQAGDIEISGNLMEGEAVYLTIPVKNFGTASSPPIHPYSEGYTSLGQLWRADGANPTAQIIDPGETINFTVQHDLWYGHVGQWTTDGVYLWNDQTESYYGPLPANGYNQQLSFNVESAQELPTIDLSISSVEPIQVVEGQDLVRDKATSVKVEVTKAGPEPVNNVQVTLSIGSSKYTAFYVADPENMKKDNNYILEKDQTGFSLNFSSGDGKKTIYFIDPTIEATGTSFFASVEVHTPSGIIDTDEENNIASSETFQVYDTRWGENNPDLELQYFLIDWEITSENPISSTLSKFHRFTNHQDNFIKGVFPVSNNRYKPDEDDDFIYSTSSYRGDDNRLNLMELLEFIYSGLPPIILSEPSKDNYIGVVPKNWFEISTNLDAWGAHFYLSPILIVEERIAKKIDPNNPNACGNPDDCIIPNGVSVVAHELGHAFGLWRSNIFRCEEYELCNIYRDNAVGNYAAPGLWVDERIPIRVTTDREINCFMGGRNGVEYWVDEKDYNDLLTGHDIPNVNITNIEIEPSGTILAVGTINNSGLVILDKWYSLTESDVDQLPTGPYSFVYLNDLGEVINQVPFDVVFEIDNGNDNIPVDSVPFVLRIPNYPGTASIEIRNNGTILAEKVISQNAPEVKVLSPNGGEVYDKTINFSWEGSDADGDDLYYTVLLSDDNGISWTPLAGNLTSNNLEWEIEHFGAGLKYKVKVIATDGFNTGEDLSDQTFSILGRLFLPLSIR